MGFVGVGFETEFYWKRPDPPWVVHSRPHHGLLRGEGLLFVSHHLPVLWDVKSKGRGYRPPRDLRKTNPLPVVPSSG